MKKRTTAALLALFLGVFGAHRWYLGQTGKGLICLTGIGAITGPIFGLYWLLSSNESFDAKFNAIQIQKEMLNAIKS